MRSQVKVVTGPGQQFTFDLDEAHAMPADAARTWLDEQFVALDCEPLRPTGKLLMVDKVLVVAQAGGARLFSDEAWGQAFARAAVAALAKPVVRVDLPTMAVTF